MRTLLCVFVGSRSRGAQVWGGEIAYYDLGFLSGMRTGVVRVGKHSSSLVWWWRGVSSVLVVMDSVDEANLSKNSHWTTSMYMAPRKGNFFGN